MCFRPVKVEKKPEVTIAIEGLTPTAGPPKQIKVDVKNTGPLRGSMMDKALVREASGWKDVEVPVTWSPASLSPGETSTATLSYDWASGKTYYVTALTKEGPSAKLYVKTP